MFSLRPLHLFSPYKGRGFIFYSGYLQIIRQQHSSIPKCQAISIFNIYSDFQVNEPHYILLSHAETQRRREERKIMLWSKYLKTAVNI
jgi:hypothetical protein